MRTEKTTKLLALLLCGLMTLSLFACDNNVGETQGTTDEVTTEATTEETTDETESESETSSTVSTTTTEETTTEETTTEETTTEETTTEETTTEETTTEETTTEELTTEEVTGDYSNGNGIGYAGDLLEDDAYAFTVNEIDESKATAKTAEEMLKLLLKKDGVKAGEVYKVTGAIKLESDKTYYGNFATVIAEDGVIISGKSGVILRDIIIKGNITIENSSDLNIFKVDVKAERVGISIDEMSEDIMISNSIVSAKITAVKSDGARVSVYRSMLTSNQGVSSGGSDFTIQNSIINANSIGILSIGQYFIARNNTITVSSDTQGGIGIAMTKGSYNSMAALNVINDVQKSVYVADGYNCVVILNRLITVEAEGNTHFYMIKNRLGGEISLKNNKYLIADGNTFIEDNRNHPTILEGNSEFNGDNLHDVNARLEFGADEDLLPHTDTEQFTNMPIRTSITDLASSATQNYSSYVGEEAAWNKIVIIPPGAYTSSSAILFTKLQSNTDLYAYGSKAIATYTVGNILRVDSAENVRVFGFTGSHNRSTCGQVHILDIDPKTNKVLVTVSAGFVDGFWELDPTDPRDDCGYNPDFCTYYHATDDLSTIGAADNYSGGPGRPLDIVDNGDGTYTLTLKNVNNVKLGDLIVTRLGARGQNSLFTTKSDNIYYKDLTLYSATNSRNCATYCGQITYERFSSPKDRGYEISEEVYNTYKAMEKKYGVNLGVYYDEVYKIYRGPDPIWGATACMEINANYKGTHVISSYWRSTTDDGTNQRGTSSRIAGMVKNNDGTYTVYYKGNLNSVYRGSIDKNATSVALNNEVAQLEVGNKIIAYTANGGVLINDAIVLTAPVAGSPEDVHIVHKGTTTCTECGAMIRDGYTFQELGNSYIPMTGSLTFTTRHPTGSGNIVWTTTVWSVTIEAKYVNEELLEEYDFCLNTDQPAKRVTLDNVSRNCTGIYYDNTLITDIKSRGILAKASDVTIKNCTFRDITMQALVLGAEEEWGEATVARNVLIENNVFDNCATNANSFNMVPIDIRGVATTNESIVSNVAPHEGMVASNFVIRNNKFVNTATNHMICITGARDINISGNIFEENVNSGETIYINGCYNVTVKDNHYTERMQELFDKGNYSPIADIYNCEKVIVENLKIPEKVTMKPK